jgi:hypothetical protein
MCSRKSEIHRLTPVLCEREVVSRISRRGQASRAGGMLVRKSIFMLGPYAGSSAGTCPTTRLADRLPRNGFDSTRPRSLPPALA